MSRHKRHMNTLRKLYDSGWFVLMAKPAYHTGAAEVYLGIHTPSFVRQAFVHAENFSNEKVRRYYAPPILTGCTMFVLRKWKGEGRRRTEIKNGWRELGRFALQEASRTKNEVS